MLPLAADDSDKLGKLLSRAAENAVKGESAGTIQFSAKDGPQDILAFSWGVSNGGTFSGGAGGGAGKAQFSDFSFVKRLDKASPVLMQSCARGSHYPEVIVSLKDRKGTTYMVVKFNDVLISSYQTGGSSGDQDPLDAISLNFAQMTIDGLVVGDPKS